MSLLVELFWTAIDEEIGRLVQRKEKEEEESPGVEELEDVQRKEKGKKHDVGLRGWKTCREPIHWSTERETCSASFTDCILYFIYFFKLTVSIHG